MLFIININRKKIRYGTKFQKKWLAQRSGGSVLARFDYDYYLKQESLYTKLYIDQ
jgi:hypothetical protein